MSTETAHFYEPGLGHRLPHDPFAAIVGPRPIGWIGTRAGDGGRNLAPYSFFNGFNYRPPIVGFASVGWKDTVQNVSDTREFTWNLATRALAEHMNSSSAEVGADVDEFALAGLTAQTSRVVSAPRVQESPVNFECRLTQLVRLGDQAGHDLDTWLVLGEVVAVHIDKVLLRDGIYITAAAGPILRAGGSGDYFSITDSLLFRMKRPRSIP